MRIDTQTIRRVLMMLLLGAFAGVVALHVTNPSRVARLEMLQRDHDRLQTVSARVARENERLRSELRALEHGVEGWRTVARREYGMVMDGEVVFRFPPPVR